MKTTFEQKIPSTPKSERDKVFKNDYVTYITKEPSRSLKRLVDICEEIGSIKVNNKACWEKDHNKRGKYSYTYTVKYEEYDYLVGQFLIKMSIDYSNGFKQKRNLLLQDKNPKDNIKVLIQGPDKTFGKILEKRIESVFASTEGIFIGKCKDCENIHDLYGYLKNGLGTNENIKSPKTKIPKQKYSTIELFQLFQEKDNKKIYRNRKNVPQSHILIELKKATKGIEIEKDLRSIRKYYRRGFDDEDSYSEYKTGGEFSRYLCKGIHVTHATDFEPSSPTMRLKELLPKEAYLPKEEDKEIRMIYSKIVIPKGSENNDLVDRIEKVFKSKDGFHYEKASCGHLKKIRGYFKKEHQEMEKKTS